MKKMIRVVSLILAALMCVTVLAACAPSTPPTTENKVSTLEEFRKDIAARPREFLDLIKKTEKATGVPITAELYKRPKEAPSEELAPYFAWRKYIACAVDEPVSPEIFGPELGKRAGEFLEKLIPLYDYFNRFKA